MKIKYRIYWLILMGVLSCQNLTEFNSDATTLNIGVSESTEMDFSQYLKIGDILPLKQKMGDPLGIVDKIQIEGDRIYVLDRQSSNALFCYDTLGNPIKKITTEGNGPGEVGTIWDFEVHPEKDQITIISNNPNKQIIFNKEGRFLSESNPDFRYIYYCNIKDEIDLYEVRPRSNFNYFHWGSQGEITHKEIDITSDQSDVRLNRRAQRGGFKQINNEIFSLPTLSNIIYKLDEKGAVQKYVLDIGELTPSYDRFKAGDMEMSIGLTIEQSNDYLVISYATEKKGFHICVLNTKTNDYVVGPIFGKGQFSSLGGEILFSTVYADEKGFIANISSDYILKIKTMLQEDHEGLNDLFVDVCKTREQLEAIDPSDNVLVRFKVKGI